MTITSKDELSTKGRLLLSLWQRGSRTEAQILAAVPGAISQDEADFILAQPKI